MTTKRYITSRQTDEIIAALAVKEAEAKAAKEVHAGGGWGWTTLRDAYYTAHNDRVRAEGAPVVGWDNEGEEWTDIWRIPNDY